jgi:hypothetical protein
MEPLLDEQAANRLLKKAHLLGPSLRLGTPRAWVLVAAYP